jgi:hypothetical protein
MLQQRQIVKSLGMQIDKDPGYIEYANTTFSSIVWIFIYVYVTIYRTVPLQRYESSHCIIATKLRGCV